MASTVPLPIPSSPPSPSSSKFHHNQSQLSSSSTISALPTKTQPQEQQVLPSNLNGNSQLLLQHQSSLNPKQKTPTLRFRLSQLCQEGRLELARRLFDTVPRPTTVLWNTIIIGFICNGMPEEALRFYVRMKNTRATRSDSYTYSSALKACAETKQLKFGRAVHCQILRSHSNPSVIVNNSLLNMYANCLSPPIDNSAEHMGQGIVEFYKLDLVQKLFDRMRKRNVVAWNTIIAWYVKTGRYVEAIRQFKLMLKMGIKPTVVSFINVFPAVAGIGDKKNSDVLYGSLVKMGNGYVDDLFAVSSAIFMYSELADMNSARRVFGLSIEKNTEVWNTMIDGYVQNDHPLEGLNLFLQVLEMDQIVPDSVTFLSALTAASQLQRLDFGQQIHAFVIKNSMAHSIITSNALIVMYSRCDSIESAFKVFEKMSEKRDLVSWNTMVSSFVQNGFDDEGLILVYEMQKQGFLIDYITATALLSAASNVKNGEIGKQTHAYLFRHGIQLEGIDSYLIDMYAKSGLINNAKRLFEYNDDTRNRDQVTWNAMISGYVQNGYIELGITVLRQMLKQNEIPNAVTIASILPACNLIGGISLGRQLHGFAFRHLVDQNVFVGTALIDMYSKCGAIDYAEKVFASLHEKNSVTYTTMILGYGQHGLGSKALSLFQSMCHSGMKPDAITFVAILSACSYAGFVDEGLQIFESMEREHMIQPTTEHYCCFVDMLGRAGRVEEAYEFVKELGNEGNVVGIWGSLLGACRIHGNFELGKVIATKLLEMEKENGMAGYHVLLSNIYAEEGKWEDVDEVRKSMKEKGLRKEAGCSWIEVGGVVNRFMSGDQNHSQSGAIYAKLEELSEEMKIAGYRPLICNMGSISESDD